MIAIFCAVLSGGMFFLSQGLADVWLLGWIAPLPLLWLAYGKTGAWQLFFASVLAFAAGEIYAIQVYWDFIFIAQIATLCIALAILFAAAILFARATWRRLPPWAVLFAFPALWTGIEYLISLVSPHGSFGALGYAETPFAAAIQIASLFGVYAVSFSLCLFANALALVARGARRTGAAGIALVALDLVFGFVRLAQPQGDTVRVAALSDAGLQRRAFHNGAAGNLAATQDYAAVIRAEAAKGVHDFVIPEGALKIPQDQQAAIAAPLASVARDTGSLVVAGAITLTPYQDVALAFSASTPMRTYAKRHLLRPLESKFAPGDAPGLIGQGRAMAICKDMDFPATLRADAGGGAIRLMLVPAGDFIGDGWLHGRMAVMGGVENGFAVLRSAFRGLQTISDAEGRVLASASTSRLGMIVTQAEVPLGPGPTLYTRIGDLFAWACLLATLGFAGVMLTRRDITRDEK